MVVPAKADAVLCTRFAAAAVRDRETLQLSHWQKFCLSVYLYSLLTTEINFPKS